MNKPEMIEVMDKSVYDDLQKKITDYQRMLEACLSCCMKESADMLKSDPELYAMIRCSAENAAILHVHLGTLQKQLFADGALSKAHADSFLPWWGPDMKLVNELVAVEAGGCK